MRPEARALAGCLVLELCARSTPGGAEPEATDEERRPRRPRVLVLDTHPAMRVASVAFRACPSGETRCGFVFSSGAEGEPGRPAFLLPPPPPARPSSAPAGHPHPHCPLSTASALSAFGQAPPEGDRPGLESLRDVPPSWGEPPPAGPWACSPLESAEVPAPPLPAFPRSAPCPLFFRVDPFTDYGSALSISLPASLEPQRPFQIIVRYTTVDAPAVSGEAWFQPRTERGLSRIREVQGVPKTP